MEFEINEFEDATAQDIVGFVEANSEEIENFFPHFDLDEVGLGSGYKLVSGDQFIGLFIYVSKGLEAHVEIDYVIPEFQDKGIGKEFFLRMIDEFRTEGYEEIISLTDNARHKEYLFSIGFKQSERHRDRFYLELL